MTALIASELPLEATVPLILVLKMPLQQKCIILVKYDGIVLGIHWLLGSHGSGMPCF